MPDRSAQPQPPAGHAGHAATGGSGDRVRAEATRHFLAVRDSARQARHFVQDQLGSRADRAVAIDAAIVAAELAANAMVHARSAFTVTVTQRMSSVRISVRDAMRLEDGQPLAAAPGHGLDVVAKVAARWAIEPLPDGKVVWAELPAAPRGEG